MTCMHLPILLPYGPFFHRTQDAKKAPVDDVKERPASADEDVSGFTEDFDAVWMASLDPLAWKEQDHYRILGLSDVRWDANEDLIRRAYRRLVLKYHPDKNGGRDNYFKCLQKAYDIMSEPVKRRQWDSIDPEFDDGVPSQCSPADFYTKFGAIFKANAHFSKSAVVPALGDAESPRAEVEAFYAFWSRFDSWRSFEMLDEEASDSYENRDEKRYIEKLNKQARVKRKNEESARIGKLVETSMRLDPRIQAFKAADKAEKEAKRYEKNRQQKEAEEERRRAAEREEQEKQAREAAEKEQRGVAKKEKERQKSQMKQLRKRIRESAEKFKLPEAQTESVIADAFNSGIDALERLLNGLTIASSTNAARALFSIEQETIDTRVQKEEAEKQETAKPVETAAAAKDAVASTEKAEWTVDEIKLLIKSVNMFPGGTGNRWQTISDHMHLHYGAGPQRTPDEIIQKSREVMQGGGLGAMLQRMQRAQVDINDAPTMRAEVAPIESAEETAAPAETTPLATDAPLPWTTEEQSKLETALRAYPSAGPSAYTGADRWERITAMVDGRSKKEVLARVKELVSMTKQKKK